LVDVEVGTDGRLDTGLPSERTREHTERQEVGGGRRKVRKVRV